MKTVKFIMIFIVLMLMSLILTMPASFVLKQITLDKKLSYGPIQGTWWSFNVEWISYQGVTFNKTHFSINPMCLLQASVCIDAKNDQAKVRLNKPVYNKDIRVEDSVLSMSFDQLSPFMTTLFVKPTGDFTLSIKNLTLSNQTITELAAILKWQNVGVQGESFNLGSIQANINHQPTLINIDLSDQSAVLDLSGKIKVSKTGFIDSQIQLKTLANFPSPIKTVIQSVMQKRGRNVFEYQSKLNIRQLKSLKIDF